MTRGELTVIGVRAQSLADELQAAITLGKIAIIVAPPGPRRDPFWLSPDLEREAQRLLSSCERALGTRERHYDVAGEEFPFDVA